MTGHAACRPPPEHDAEPWHWVATPEFPEGEPMRWDGAWLRSGDDLRETLPPPDWRWLAVAGPPGDGLGDRGS